MDPNEKNVVDKFLDAYEDINNSRPKKVRVYKRPSKIKCILYFGMSVLILLFVLITIGFYLNLPFIIFLLVDIGVGAFYGYNLFSKNGIGLPTYENKYEDDDNDKE